MLGDTRPRAETEEAGATTWEVGESVRDEPLLDRLRAGTEERRERMSLIGSVGMGWVDACMGVAVTVLVLEGVEEVLVVVLVVVVVVEGGDVTVGAPDSCALMGRLGMGKRGREEGMAKAEGGGRALDEEGGDVVVFVLVLVLVSLFVSALLVVVVFLVLVLVVVEEGGRMGLAAVAVGGRARGCREGGAGAKRGAAAGLVVKLSSALFLEAVAVAAVVAPEVAPVAVGAAVLVDDRMDANCANARAAAVPKSSSPCSPLPASALTG